MAIEDHPGFLGWTSRGVVLIHADWPSYAIEHGAAYALERLGQFPADTRFYAIDDIDQCLLFRVGRSPVKDEFSSHLFHVALWYEDVVDLLANGWIEGVKVLPSGQWADWSDEPDQEPADGSALEDRVPLVSPDGILVTAPGIEAFRETMIGRYEGIPSAIRERVDPLIRVNAYDAAVREACVVLESEVRSVVASTKYGAQLIEEYCAGLKDRVPQSYVRWLRTEVRASFTYVRNDFMHNLRSLSRSQCLALVCRVGATYALAMDAIRAKPLTERNEIF